ncbi:zinc finger protein 777-like isoform X2 [Micropterus dolomieu]|nr:zinc finger protein 777-like isoform X2 [Micropterus dolomieu]
MDQEDPPEPPLIKEKWSHSLDQVDPPEPPLIKEKRSPSLDQEDSPEPPLIKEKRSPSLDQEDPAEPPLIKEKRSPSLDQEDPAEHSLIKDEQEELWTSQEGEQLRGLEEAEITKSPFTPVPMKSEEDDEEKPQSSQLHQRLTEQMETKTNGDDCGGPEPARNSDPDGHFQPEVDDKMSHSEPKTDDSCDWEETREPQSGSNPLQSNEVPQQEQSGLQTPEPPHIKRKWSSCMDQEDPPELPLIKEEWSPILDQEDPPEPPLIKEKWSHILDQVDPPEPLHIKEKRSPSLDQDDSPEPPLIKEKRSPSLDQEDPAEPPLIKDKQEELWTSQEGEQIRGLDEAEIIKSPFTPVPMKSEEDDEEKPQSSQLHQRLTDQMKTEIDGEDCGGPEPARNSDPDGHFQPEVDDKMSHSEPKTDDSCDWEETREPQSGSNPLQSNEVPQQEHIGLQTPELPHIKEKSSPSMDQEDPPEPTDIKDEQDELWTSQEGKQLQEHQRLTEQMETKTDGEDCGGPEPARNSNPDGHFQPEVDDKMSHSEPKTDDNCDWEETRERQSGSNPLQSNEVPQQEQSGLQTPEPPHIKRKWSSCMDQEDPPELPLIKEEWSPILDQEDPPEPPLIKEKWSHSLDQVDPPEPPLIKEKRSPSLDQDDSPEPPLIKEKRSPSLDQEDPAEPPLIKDKQEELWTSQEGEQIRGLEEAEITKSPFTPVPMKSEEDDEEKPQSSQLHQRLTDQMETKTNGDDCGGPEPARNSDPDGHFQPEVDDKMSHSEPKTDDSCDWEETREPQSGSNPLQSNEVPLQEHNGLQTPELPHIKENWSSSMDQEEDPPEPPHIKRKWSPSMYQEDPPEPPHIKRKWSPSMYQEDPPEPPHIKDEQEELWTSQEGKQLQEHQRLTDQMETETDGEDCGGPEPTRNSDPDGHFQPEVDDKMSHSEPKTDDSCDWEETREPQSGSNPLQNNEVHGRDQECSTGTTSSSSSECATSSGHNGLQTGVKPLSCSVCGKTYLRKNNLTCHMRCHSVKIIYSCSVCERNFISESVLSRHKRSHTAEKPFCCPDCGKRYSLEKVFMTHMRLHSGEKRFSCSVCKETFPCRGDLGKHMEDHKNRNKGYGCSVCGKRFSRWSQLNSHQCVVLEETRKPQSGSKPSQNNEVPVSDQECSTVKTSSSSSECATSSGHKPNDVPVSDQECSTVKTSSSSSECATSSGHNPQTEEKPFRCSVCGKTYVLEHTLKKHMRLHSETQFYRCSICNQTFITESSVSIHERSHTVENPFSCSVCGKGFTLKQELRRHMKAGLHLTVVS